MTHKETNEYTEEYYSIMYSFSFSGTQIMERKDWRQSKIIGGIKLFYKIVV